MQRPGSRLRKRENRVNIRLSDHFTYGRLIRFTLPTIGMMLFSSVYGIVDGLFVSNFVGKTPFAAVNLIMPLPMLFAAVGFMLGSGGSALVAKTLGEGKRERANQLFSMIVAVTVIAGVFFSLLGVVILRPVAILLGAEGQMLEDCMTYGLILVPGLCTFMLQNAFQSFCITAEKPHFGLKVTVLAGVGNIVLDALFVAAFRWGLAGAALATVLSQVIGGAIPLIYFLRPNNSLLRLVRPAWDWKALGRSCLNGASEFLVNVSASTVSMIFNLQLMAFAGEDGVAAYGVIMYVNFIFLGTFIGYSNGCAPVVGFHYGAQNHQELRSLHRKSLKLVGAGGIILTAVAVALSRTLSSIFVSYDEGLFEMTVHAFRVYSLSFLFMGVNVFASAFFTALNDGLISGLISTLRTLVFQVAAVLVLPRLLGLDGIWLSVVAGELLAMIVSIVCFVRMQPRYRY